MMDPRTVAIVMMISGAECSFLFFAAGALRRKNVAWPYPPSFFWGLGTAVHVLGMLSLLTQGLSSPWIGIVLANTLIILGQLLILAGLRRLAESGVSLLRYGVSLILYFAFTLVLTFALPSTPARVVLFSLSISAFYLEGMILCLGERLKATRPLAPAMAGVFGFLAAFFLARAAASILLPRPSIFSPTAFNALTFVVSEFGLVAWCLGLILMQNRRTELDLELAYREKETLLRELQHRVKNSISVISGLMSLESSRVEDRRMLQILDRLQDRISAIAELYDQLFRSGDTGQVELDAYLAAVAEALFAGQAADARGIGLELALEGVRIDTKRAVPLGLIANELLSDSLKHAFSGKRGGKVRLSLRREDGDLVLAVEDDGIGLPPGFSVGASAGLGLVLVDMLAAQVGGALASSSGGGGAGSGFAGARFAVRCPLAAKG